MGIRYPGLQKAMVDIYEGNHKLVPGAWHDKCVFKEVNIVPGPTSQTRGAKRDCF